MKKIYTLALTIIIASVASGQNLVINGGTEQWDDTTHPTGWTKAENIEQETTIVHSGTYSAKHTGDGTKDFGQYISVTPGETYLISLWYYSIYADGEDCRIWSYWKNDGASLDDNADELRGPGNGYLPGTGEWLQYTTQVTAPALATDFYLEVRTYTGSVTYWDDFSVTQVIDNPPVWSSGYPLINSIVDTGGDLWVSLDEPGTVYYVILEDGSTPPSSEELKAGLDYGTTTILKAGSFEVAMAETPVLEVLDGAMPETAYDIYIVAEDQSQNLQSVPYRFDVTTGGLRSITITNPVAYETYSVGQVVTFEWTSTNIDNVLIGGYHYRFDELFIIASDDQDNPLPIDASLGEYTYTIPNDIGTDSIDIYIWNEADTSVYDKVSPIYMYDQMPPDVDILWPANLEVDVNPSTTPYIYFGEEIFIGSGKVYLRNNDGTLFEEMDISAAGIGENLEIVDYGYGIKITPTSPFLNGNTYYIEMDGGIVTDYFENIFAGFAGSGTWSFTILKSSDASLADLMISGTSVDGFLPGTLVYSQELAGSTTEVPVVTATPTDPNADVTVIPASNLTGTGAERTTTITVVSDDESTTLVYSITFELATSVESSLVSRLRIYPVPVSHELYIENIQDIKSIEVLDLTGNQVYKASLVNAFDHRINVTLMPKGIYLLRLSDGKSFTTRKFIKR